MREDVIRKIEEKKLIAIIRGLDTRSAVKTAGALAKGGVALIEVTFDQKHPETFSETAESIRQIKASLSDVFVGAGTVLSLKQVDLAKDAGAEFIISPDADEAVIKHTVKNGLVSIPGAYTATEIKKAHEAGADFVKLFPCVGDARAVIKALTAPLSHIRLLAVGGVDADNCADFLRAGAVGVGVGGSLVKKDWIQDGAFDKITDLAKTFTENLKGREN